MRASGLFDPAWYLAQVGALPEGVDPLEDFVRRGDSRRRSPHPVFDATWYLSQLPSGTREVASGGPFLHYLRLGARRGYSPHPLFDAKAYLKGSPSSAKRAGGPLAHFLRRAAPLDGRHGATGRAWDEPSGLLAAARAAGEEVLATRGYRHIARETTDFDLAASEEVKARLRSVPLPPDPPVVSVVVATKDRADVLGETLDSVLAQTYPHWQLVVVDDGSRDGTAPLLRRYEEDERVVVVRHETARGVSAARNAGLARATGELVSYLDSDNTWMPDFLELMVRHLLQTGDRAAYGVTSLKEVGGKGRHLYRAVPFDREHLKERNYIDCIALVHERSLLERSGVFDETLRRNVDWDLFLRLAEETDLTLVPIVATEYDLWTDEGERISNVEPMAYRYLVRQRAMLDWADLSARLTQRDDELLSLVVVASGDGREVVSTVRRAQELAQGPLEVVVVDAQSPSGDFALVHAEFSDEPGVLVHRLTQPLPLSVARNVGASLTTGSSLVFLAQSLWLQPGWDQVVREGLSAGHRIVAPLVLDRGGSVWSAGLEHVPGGQVYLPWVGFSGTAPEVRQPRLVSAVSDAVVAVRAQHLVQAQGFDPLTVEDLRGGCLSLRVVAVAGEDSPGSGVLLDPRWTTSWRGEVPITTGRGAQARERANAQRQRVAWTEAGAVVRPVEEVLPGYRAVGLDAVEQEDQGFIPLVVHDRQPSSRPLRWALKVTVPRTETRELWGDWHFASALADSLERLGHEVSIDAVPEWYRPTAHLDDVVLVLRGRQNYRVNPAQTNITWVISHPDLVKAPQLQDFDLVFGASPRWCEDMAARTGRPVETLWQCTDQRRFHPVPADPAVAHPVLAVANARGMRPMVGAALEAGVVPAVYGSRWEGLLPDGAWLGHHVPNDELVTYYCSAGVVLNDHWGDMREQGLVSNRLFDLAACEARMVSDHLPEIAEVFGELVPTWEPGQDLAQIFAAELEDGEERRARRAELGARVRAEHTFDARAAQLSESVAVVRSSRGTPANFLAG